MSVEGATYINQLDPTLPASGDLKSEGDNHLRLLKFALKATFPNLTAAPCTPTTNDLNTLAGAATTGATGMNVVTQAASSNSTLAASTAQVQAAILAASGITAALPGQAGNAGKFLTTDGVSVSWSAPSLALVVVTATTATATAGQHLVLTNAALSAVTLPASPVAGDTIAITVANGLYTNTFDSAAKTVAGPGGAVSGVITMDARGTVTIRYIDNTTQWVVL